MLKRDTRKLKNTIFDLVIIGGGIYGVCIAWEATLRGLSVALIEQEDFGHATSANSLKTIHGGLRYLQNFDISRMRQSIRDRLVLMRIAPHLVHPLPTLMPIYGHLMNGREMMAVALAINDLISYDRNQLVDPDKNLPRGKIISKEECLSYLPEISKNGLSGGAIWYDGQVYNSERLTLSFALSAVRKGASIANYLKANRILKENGRVTGVGAIDQLSGESLKIRGKVIINAAGPWVDQILNMINGKSPLLGIQLAKAVNIATRPIFKQYAVGLSGKHQGNRFQSEERLFFVTPWRNQSLVGTTYKYFDAHPDTLIVNEGDIQELLESFNKIYPPANLSLSDIKFVYCGLVPIYFVNDQTSKFKRARHYQIRDHDRDGYPGLVSVMGVKYTTARDVAVKVVDQISKNFGLDLSPSISDKVVLHGGDIENFNSFLESKIDEAPHGLKPQNIRSLLYNYGTIFPEVLRYFGSHNDKEESINQELSILKAQIAYSVDNEMAMKLGDIIFRRTGIGTSGRLSENTLNFCAAEMGQLLNWDEVQIKDEIQAVKNSYPYLAFDK